MALARSNPLLIGVSRAIGLMLLTAVVAGPGAARAAAIEGRVATIAANGRNVTGDGAAYDNTTKGIVVEVRADQGDFEVQSKRAPFDRSRARVYLVGVAVQVNDEGDFLRYHAKRDELAVSEGDREEIVVLNDGASYRFAGGGWIERTASGYSVASEAGDLITIAVADWRIDLRVEAGPDRQSGQLMGGLGIFDADASGANDLVDRRGTPVDDPRVVVRRWTARPGELLFNT